MRIAEVNRKKSRVNVGFVFGLVYGKLSAKDIGMMPKVLRGHSVCSILFRVDDVDVAEIIRSGGKRREAHGSLIPAKVCLIANAEPRVLLPFLFCGQIAPPMINVSGRTLDGQNTELSSIFQGHKASLVGFFSYEFGWVSLHIPIPWPIFA